MARSIKHISRSGLSGAVSASAIALCALAAPAQAQDVAPTAQAAAPAADAGGLEEIVVTAQKRKERLQDVPIAVAAVNAAMLAKAGVNQMTDLRVSVTGLNSVETASYFTPRLRGIGSSALGPGIENAVATYIDGVYMASAQSALLSLNNIEQVEVLKGPQGTLFGRNATGGLIQITTREPTADPSADIRLEYANYDTITASAYVSGGITDGITADLAVRDSHQGKGWGVNEYNGKDVWKTDQDTAVRSKLVIRPGDTTKITLIGDYARKRGSTVVYTVAPGKVSPYTGTVSDLTGYNTDTNINPYLSGWNWGVSGKLEQELGDLTLMSLSAFRKSRYSFQFDLDYTAANGQEIYPTDQGKTFSQEIQLQPTSNMGKLKWVVGAYYFYSQGGYDPNIVALPMFGITAYNTSQQTTKSVAGFAQGTYEIVNNLNITLGGRYTYEKRALIGTDRTFLYGGDTDIAPPVSVDKSVNFKKFTFRASIDYKPTPDTLLYASFNRGFKSGGFNAGTITDAPFRPEVLDAYELGFKSDWLGRSLRINGAAFYYDYKDIQVQIVRLGAIGILNGASARIYGADLDVEAKLSNELTIAAGAEYLDSKFKSFPSAVISNPAGGTPITYGPVDGNRLPVNSKLTANARISYVKPIAGGEINATANAYYNSGWFSEPDNVVRQNRFVQFNASLGWTGDDGLSLTIWGKNLTDKRINSYASTPPEGTPVILWAPPRTYGVTLGAKL